MVGVKRLITGPAGQDKLSYALRSSGFPPYSETLVPEQPAALLNRGHLAIRQGMERGMSREEMEAALLRYDVVVADEIGAGVIPLDPFEQAWREETGRLLCAYAKRADVVERMLVGIPMVIKGEKTWN